MKTGTIRVWNKSGGAAQINASDLDAWKAQGWTADKGPDVAPVPEDQPKDAAPVVVDPTAKKGKAKKG